MVSQASPASSRSDFRLTECKSYSNGSVGLPYERIRTKMSRDTRALMGVELGTLSPGSEEKSKSPRVKAIRGAPGQDEDAPSVIKEQK